MRVYFFCLLIVNCCFSVTFSQVYHYKFSYNNNGIVNDKLFEALEEDLGTSVSYNVSSAEYSYIQHLKNQNLYSSTLNQIESLMKEDHLDQLHHLLVEAISMFPYQTPVHYYLARFYFDRGNVDQAIAVLKKAVLDFGLEPESFSYLLKLYAENETFVNGYSNIQKLATTRNPIVAKDSCLIAVVDTIKKNDQFHRTADNKDPLFLKQQLFDSTNARTLRSIVTERGWIGKYLGRDYPLAHVPVMHFKVHDQIFFLHYIISDCVSYNANWTGAEQVIWKIVNHTSRVEKKGERFHSIPQLHFFESGKIDIEKSILAINSTAIALLGSKKNKPIWLVATSEHPDKHHVENLELLKKYLIILGYGEDKIFIQNELLDCETESNLLLKTPVVIKEVYGSN
jgi:tetratricopeptide (TPR) repeat protein